jgi:glycosyltransferase involved in cell wall biosynthesis
LIAYAEDLMSYQVKSGHDVYYFCTGRSSIFLGKPVIKTWQSKQGYKVFELWNPPIISGGTSGVSNPQLDISEPITEKLFMEVINKLQPDIVHFQEFVGIPTSLINLLKNIGIKTVFTIGDYFTLCPVLTLVRKDGPLCVLNGDALGKKCTECCINAPVNSKARQLKRSVLWLQRFILGAVLIKGLVAVNRLVKTKAEKEKPMTNDFDGHRSAQYLQRRLINLTNLSNLDLILAVSNRVASLFNAYTPLPKMEVLNITLNHLGGMSPRAIQINDKSSIRLALTNAMGSSLKGKDLMLDVFERVQNSSIRSQVQFVIFGNLDDEVGTYLKKYDFVHYYGKYQADDLDRLLQELDIHTGIIPSLWEEAYGFVGVEFLAKGIPVIGNRIGGITDYVIEGETGWLNHSLTANEMFDIINNIVDNPQSIMYYNNNLLKNRHKYIKDMNFHGDEIEALYRKLLGDKRAAERKED